MLTGLGSLINILFTFSGVNIPAIFEICISISPWTLGASEVTMVYELTSPTSKNIINNTTIKIILSTLLAIFITIILLIISTL